MNNLRQFRKKAGLTQRLLGRLAGISQVAISHIETGRTLKPSDLIRRRLAVALRVKVETLFPDTETYTSLRRYRVSNGFTQWELAQISGVSQVTISYIENGLTNPTKRTLKKLAQALDIPLQRLTS